jgi:sulfatase maturation enzyme AslB (radical SAM superfamily)
VQPLSDRDRLGIDIQVIECPKQGSPHLSLAVKVAVTNSSSVCLSSTEPNPFHLSYFWISPDGKRIEGLRTVLPRVIPSGRSDEIVMSVRVPSKPGLLTLRLTAVQEHVCWLMDSPWSAFRDMQVSIGERWWKSAADVPVFGELEILNDLALKPYLMHNGMYRPLMLTIETTNTCNFDCIFCAYGSTTRTKEVMSLDLFERALDQYVESGGGPLSLTPMVGDVFLDRFLPKRLELIRKRPSISKVSFTTNASLFQLFSDQDLKSILGNVDRVFISIYGCDAEEHRMITKRDKFTQVVGNIQRAFTLVDGDDKIRFGFRLLKNSTRERLSRWIVDTFGRLVIFNWTTQYINWLGGVDTSRALPFDAIWIKETVTDAKCVLPLVACHIFTNGDVSFCPCDNYNGVEEFNLGNIRTSHLLSLCNSDKARSLWLKLPGTCQTCTQHRPLAKLSTYEDLFTDPINFTGG